MIRQRIEGQILERRIAPHRARHNARVVANGIPRVRDFIDLQSDALALCSVDGKAIRPVVRLLIPTISTRQFFAGIRTAVIFAAEVARSRGWVLEICHYGAPLGATQSRLAHDRIASITDLPFGDLRIRSAWEPAETNEDDLYIATFWTTAVSAWVACQIGLLSTSRIILLVQDYEPEFYAASTESALSKMTYHAGFELVLNSSPLAEFLTQREGVYVNEEFIFRPEIDEELLKRAAARRARSQAVRILFYGRPSSHRNSFSLGIASLRIAERAFASQSIKVEYNSVGEKHRSFNLENTRVHSMGKLAWAEYFDLLARTDVMLSFQQTPHPSHPPLDAVASGTYAVMNELASTRGGLSPRLLVAPTDPVSIARKLDEAVQGVIGGQQTNVYDEAFVQALGQPMNRVASLVSAALG